LLFATFKCSINEYMHFTTSVQWIDSPPFITIIVSDISITDKDEWRSSSPSSQECRLDILILLPTEDLES
jgi:hypothetical protein